MISVLFRAKSPSKSKGFTLIELLVVVAILGVLIAILIPTLSRARTMAKRTICATNLKGQGNSFAMISSANNDQLPNDAGGNWLHDYPNVTCDHLVGTTLSNSSGESAMSIRKWFYCPTNFDSNQDNAWDGGQAANITTPPPYRWLDYAYFNSRGAGTVLPTATYATTNGRKSGKGPKLTWRTKMVGTFQASDAELVADELITSGTSSGDWSLPCQASNFKEYSSHLKGLNPEGMNVLCCDGHVSWRTFPGNGSVNITPIAQTGPNAFFWVIDP